MRRSVALLEGVLVRRRNPFRGAETLDGQPVLEHIANDIFGVLHAVDIADLVAVVRRDGHLGDGAAGMHHLGDDLGVEIEPVAVGLEWNCLQDARPVGPVSGMEFGQVGTEHAVLEAGQHAVT